MYLQKCNTWKVSLSVLLYFHKYSIFSFRTTAVRFTEPTDVYICCKWFYFKFKVANIQYKVHIQCLNFNLILVFKMPCMVSHNGVLTLHKIGKHFQTDLSR